VVPEFFQLTLNVFLLHSIVCDSGEPLLVYIAAFRIASYVLWPFGRSVQVRRDFGIGSVIGNIIWIVLVGWELALGHLTAGILLCITIIGIPLGLANFKLIPISLIPLGVRIVPSDELYPGYTAQPAGGNYA